MRRRQHLDRMIRIAEVREVQESAAKMRVGRLQAELSRLDEQRREAAAAIAAEEARWVEAVSGASFDLQAARAWRGSVQVKEIDLGLLDQRIGSAKAETRRESEEWRLALACADVARALEDDAARALARHREEAALNEAADRHSQRRARP